MLNLYFQSSLGKRRLLGTSDNIRELRKQIREFCNQRDFHIYYTREWLENDEVMIDVGSHTEFFVLTGPKEQLERTAVG